MASKIWQCVTSSLSGMSKDPLLLLCHTLPAVNLPSYWDHVRQMANTISFSILKITLTIDDPGVRLKLINHCTWVILSKEKLWLKAPSISQYSTTVEQNSLIENCLWFRFKYEEIYYDNMIHVILMKQIFLCVCLFASFILKSLSFTSDAY